MTSLSLDDISGITDVPSEAFDIAFQEQIKIYRCSVHTEIPQLYNSSGICTIRVVFVGFLLRTPTYSTLFGVFLLGLSFVKLVLLNYTSFGLS